MVTKFLARQKFRLDMGISFLVFWNYILLAITASANIAPLVGVRARWVALVLIVLTVFGVWALGYVLDKCGFPAAYQDEQNERNQMLKAIKNGQENSNYSESR